MQIDHPCANSRCECKVKESGDYCSEACERQADTGAMDQPCECGHGACAAEADEAR